MRRVRVGHWRIAHAACNLPEHRSFRRTGRLKKLPGPVAFGATSRRDVGQDLLPGAFRNCPSNSSNKPWEALNEFRTIECTAMAS
jgi:hypothetical protein